ncbi:juvenile hormone acid O-methyltransferase-like [Argiope bruennichi]|uniref:phosphoethanolamine N-methyltransferase n=1 Tax=Argiope bruennichi TaxID=94029 RepID=A0A8T0EQA2_ARGBR|nr:juvenile hormone acid O-methyltransferase-like [Argiope bruennichi]KAF8778073.1 Juvenile hormone acid O-methyltransferase like protein [Argiope bruennichi]
MNPLWCEFTNAETKEFLSSLQWGDLSGELVMDVGCGEGDMSTKCILNLFPRVGKIIAIDIDPYCIQRSKILHKHKKVEYRRADVTMMDHLQRWGSHFSKIVCTHCITFIEEQERAFMNMFHLLQPGGEAAIFFALRSESDDVYLEMSKKSKWSKYFQNLNSQMVLKLRKYDAAYYQNVLEKIGFTVHFCTEQVAEYVYKSDGEYKNGVRDSTFIESIPKNLRREFVEESFSTFLKMHPRNEDGMLHFKYTMIRALLKK